MSDLFKATTKSEDETEILGCSFASRLCGGDVVAYVGSFGAGKTCFTHGLAKGLGISCDITSPSYTIVNEYRGININLYHFDMYRITGEDDLMSTGFYDYLELGGICAIEWSENIEYGLPDAYFRIEFECTSVENERIITCKRVEKGNGV